MFLTYLVPVNVMQYLPIISGFKEKEVKSSPLLGKICTLSAASVAVIGAGRYDGIVGVVCQTYLPCLVMIISVWNL